MHKNCEYNTLKFAIRFRTPNHVVQDDQFISNAYFIGLKLDYTFNPKSITLTSLHLLYWNCLKNKP